MQADVKNLKGETVKTVELPAEIFEAPINKALMHQALVRQLAARLDADIEAEGLGLEDIFLEIHA